MPLSCIYQFQVWSLPVHGQFVSCLIKYSHKKKSSFDITVFLSPGLPFSLLLSHTVVMPVHFYLLGWGHGCIPHWGHQGCPGPCQWHRQWHCAQRGQMKTSRERPQSELAAARARDPNQEATKPPLQGHGPQGVPGDTQQGCCIAQWEQTQGLEPDQLAGIPSPLCPFPPCQVGTMILLLIRLLQNETSEHRQDSEWFRPMQAHSTYVNTVVPGAVTAFWRCPFLPWGSSSLFSSCCIVPYNKLQLFR